MMQIQKVVKKQELGKKVEEGLELEGYTEILQDIESLLEKLSIDLDIQRRDLYRMVQFYRTYPTVTSPMSQLSWTHYTVLITITDNEKRRFYEEHTLQNAWSVRELRKQIQKKLYEQMKKKGKIIIVSTAKPIEPEQVFKDTYNFDFLKLPEKYTEDDLKTALINTFSFKKRKPVLKEKQKISRENLCNLWL